MNEPADNPQIDQHHPDNALTGVLPDEEAYQALVAEATSAGVDTDQIAVLHGQEGIENFDFTGERHGTWAHWVRAWKNIGGADSTVLANYQEALQNGHWLIRFAVGDQSVDELAELARRHDATQLCFFDASGMTSI